MLNTSLNQLPKEIRLEKLIEKSKEKFGNRFDYSYVDINAFENNSSKIKFYCNIHTHLFESRFSDHLRKDRNTGGCPMCSKSVGSRDSMEQKILYFLKKSEIQFGNRFDYSKSVILGLCDDDEFIVHCNIHNIDFTTSAPDHLRAKNSGCCPLCRKEYEKTQRLEKRSLKYEKYINECKKIHFNKFDYSKIDRTIPILDKNFIICPKHGEFKQSISQHASGKGCPLCNDWCKDSLFASHIKNADIPTSTKNKEFIIENDIDLQNKPYDIYIEKLNLIIEIQGEQHRKTKYFMSENDLKKRKEIDNLKKEKALQYGYNYLEINIEGSRSYELDLAFKLIEILKSSTTNEIFEKELIKLNSKKVVYTSA